MTQNGAGKLLRQGIKVVAKSEEADHVNGLAQASLADIHCLPSLRQQHLHQLISTRSCMVKALPANHQIRT